MNAARNASPVGTAWRPSPGLSIGSSPRPAHMRPDLPARPATAPLTALRPRSLASIHEGERLVVQRILFDAVRARCDAAGIGEGDVLVGRGREGARVDVESAD